MGFKMKGIGSLLGKRSESIKAEKSNLLGKNPVAKHASALYKYDGTSSALHFSPLNQGRGGRVVEKTTKDDDMNDGTDPVPVDNNKTSTTKPPMTKAEKVQGSAARKAYYKRHNMDPDDTTKTRTTTDDSKTTANPEVESEELKLAKDKTKKQKAETGKAKKGLTEAQALAKQEKKARQSKNKEVRIKKRTKRQTERSERRTKEGGTKVGNFLRGAKSLVTKKR